VSRKQRIRQTLQEADQPLSTNRVADAVGAHWKTVSDDLHELLQAGEAEKKELSNRLTLWWDREIPL
jgi:predicted Zn-ribbon and HTH transcriptional regulator